MAAEPNDRNVGSEFDHLVREKVPLQEAAPVAVKQRLASQIAEALQEQGLSKAAMARRMGTSRSALDRLLDPEAPSVTLLTLQRAAHALGKGLRIELTEGCAEESHRRGHREPGPAVLDVDDRGIARYAGLDAMARVREAKQGDPGALGEILENLARYLEGGASLPREYAAFCSPAFRELSGTLAEAQEGFGRCVVQAMEELDSNEGLFEFGREIALGQGPRLPEQGRSPDGESWSHQPSRDRLGRAFCRAFHLSRRPGVKPGPRGWMPYQPFPSHSRQATVRTPFDYLDKMRFLLHLGESQTHAIEILRSAVERPPSASTIRRWMKEEGFHNKIDSREKAHQTLNFGFCVLGLVEGGIGLETALRVSARTRVWGSCGLPKATVFLRPQTVKAAYELAVKRCSKSGPGVDT